MIWSTLVYLILVALNAANVASSYSHRNTAFDLDPSLKSFTNLNTDYLNTLLELWVSYTEGYDHPLVLMLKKDKKFYEFDFVSPENLFLNHSVDTVPENVFADIQQEIPEIKTRDDLRRFKQNAIYILVRNFELDALCKSILNLISKLPYPYYDFVIMNDNPFDRVFIEQVTAYIFNSKNPRTKLWAERLITVRFGLIPKEQWDPLENVHNYTQIPLSLLEEKWQEQEEQGVMYGGSRSYRNMCRFQSMTFYKHPALESYRYTMRLEPGVEYFCNFDPFGELNEGVKYAFVLSLVEYPDTIPTLFETYLQYEPADGHRNRALYSFIDDGNNGYNLCHFWTNFEVISLDWVRSDSYNNFMDHFDKSGGFYTERWGDAPLRTLAAVELLDISEVQWMDIGYYHAPFVSCPGSAAVRNRRQCVCNTYDFEKDLNRKSGDTGEENKDTYEENKAAERVNIDMYEYSCLRNWWRFGEGKRFS